MNLADLRRLCIRRQLRVTFVNTRGDRCCINEHGASLRHGVAGWLHSDEDFALARRFEVAAVGETKPRQFNREGLERMSNELVEAAGKRTSAAKRLSLLQFQE